MLLRVDLCRSREPGAKLDPGVETHPDSDLDPDHELSGLAKEKSADK